MSLGNVTAIAALIGAFFAFWLIRERVIWVTASQQDRMEQEYSRMHQVDDRQDAEIKDLESKLTVLWHDYYKKDGQNE